MTDITNILTNDEIDAFVTAYNRPEMGAALEQRFRDMYPSSSATLTRSRPSSSKRCRPRPIRTGWHSPRPIASAASSRCSHPGAGTTNLAIHIYGALAVGVRPGELGNILFLAGVYTGIDNFAGSLKVLGVTLGALKTLAGTGNVRPKEVVPVLAGKFA